MDSIAQTSFILSRIINIVSLGIIAFVSGKLVQKYNIKVNYTRKINHFAVFFIPILLEDLFVYRSTVATTVVSSGVYALLLLSLSNPVRSRSKLITTMFTSFDRPEDRPHTLLWLSTQVIAGFAILVPLAYLFMSMNIFELTYIPVLINGIGDGLAEPVGVRFGKREYKVNAIFSTRTYSRTIAGSACVLITAIVVVYFFRDSFTFQQFIAALVLVPVTMTLAESFAPHTWDTPFLFFVGGVVLVAIVTIF
ncbi:hypothetical protein QA601_14785 [Chitinispirillales bacterium ANBcel5]|uniref:hypothetical protein n=1 Tax=Cellulosispirillum alkaliphilum TaxID=3039283 RepID=UPI002A4E4AEA|nr:hypothetical protein [Chitinispirillales bacterium ANBcel5]